MRGSTCTCPSRWIRFLRADHPPARESLMTGCSEGRGAAANRAGKKRAGWSHHSPPNGGSSVSFVTALAASMQNRHAFAYGLAREFADATCMPVIGCVARFMLELAHDSSHGTYSEQLRATRPWLARTCGGSSRAVLANAAKTRDCAHHGGLAQRRRAGVIGLAGSDDDCTGRSVRLDLTRIWKPSAPE